MGQWRLNLHMAANIKSGSTKHATNILNRAAVTKGNNANPPHSYRGHV